MKVSATALLGAPISIWAAFVLSVTLQAWLRLVGLSCYAFGAPVTVHSFKF